MARRRNLSPNPAVGTNVTGWSSSPAGYARQTGLTGLDRSTAFGGTGAVDVLVTPYFAAIAAKNYVASFQLRATVNQTFTVLINWYDAAGGTYVGNTGTTVAFTVAAGATARCEVGPYVAPAGAGAGYVRILGINAGGAAITALLVEQVATLARTYFDGSFPGASWDGAADATPSNLLTGADTWSWSDGGSQMAAAVGPVGGDGASWAETATVVASSAAAESIGWTEGGLIIALAYDQRRGRIRLDAFGLPAAALRVVVSSRPAGAFRFTEVRGGRVAVAGGHLARQVDDYEYVAGSAMTYQIVVLASRENTPDVVLATATVTAQSVLEDVWLKFIAAPVLNRIVTLVDWSDISRQSNNALYQVRGRSAPVVVTDVHTSPAVTVTLRTATAEDAQALDDALSAGYPIFLHIPVQVALASMYAAVGSYRSRRPSHRSPVRFWDVDLQQVTAPPPSVVGAAVTWQSVLDQYATWSDVLDGAASWSELVS